MESRFIQSRLDSKDWTWDKEVQSRILQMLDIISCQITNMNRKKGQQPRKPSKQFQPDYVAKAKNHVDKESKLSEEDKKDLESFFNKHNSSINILERTKDGS